MKYKRYYTNLKLEINSLFKLEGEEFLHLSNVMRTRVGETVVLFNGDGFDYYGQVRIIDKKSAVIEILEKHENNMNPKADVTLFQALVKGDKLSTIVQKNTELGTREIVLFESEFSDVKVGNKNLEKQNRVMISACKQCGSSILTKIEKELKFKEMLDEIKNYDTVLFAYENQDGNYVSKIMTMVEPNEKIAVIVGAEGGFSEKEADQIIEAGAVPVSLGKRILRAETAGIVLPAFVIFSLEK